MRNSISQESAFILNKGASILRHFLAACAGFGCNRGNSFHRSWYGAVYWICSEHSAENTGIFSLLLGSAHPEPRPSLHLTPTQQQGGWGYTELGGDTAESNDPK